jgi:hypothetical protein
MFRRNIARTLLRTTNHNLLQQFVLTDFLFKWINVDVYDMPVTPRHEVWPPQYRLPKLAVCVTVMQFNVIATTAENRSISLFMPSLHCCRQKTDLILFQLSDSSL